ncbi:MAG: hypothetical protein JO250_11630 [Armatimonadetes bacterium]|nr:hypothetical protein [Armatimonadota bacterium]
MDTMMTMDRGMMGTATIGAGMMPGMMSGMGTMPGMGMPNMMMMPRCTMSMEMCEGGMRMTCRCEDPMGAQMMQSLCQMMEGAACSCCCLMNGMCLCMCNMMMATCKCEMMDGGVMMTCTSGDMMMAKMIQACGECMMGMMDAGCLCCVMMGGMPVCCCTK